MPLRDYHPTDLADVVQLFHRSVRDVCCRDYTPEQLAAWSPEPPNLADWAQRLAQLQVLVCAEANAIWGFVGFGPYEDSATDGLIDLLYVHPEHQHQGVGTLLLRKALARLQQRGLARVWAHVSLTAEPFFASQGFEIVQRQIVTRRGVSIPNCVMLRTPLIPK